MRFPSEDIVKTLEAYLTLDYPYVRRRIRSIGLPLGIELGRTKPYTMMTLFMTSELGVRAQTRRSCAAFVDLTGRILTRIDDAIDTGESDYLDRANEASSSSTLERESTTGELYTAADLLVNRDIVNGLLSPQSALNLRLTFRSLARRMKRGVKFQIDSRFDFDNLPEPKKVPPTEELFKSYVDMIAGDLFTWALVAIEYYAPDTSRRVRALRGAIRSFGRIFQMYDDIYDMPGDLVAGELSTAVAAVLRYGDSGQRRQLSAMAKWKSGKRLSLEYFRENFGGPCLMLESAINSEYSSMDESLSEARFRFRAEDISHLQGIYPAFRARIDRTVNGHSAPLPEVV